MLKLSAEDMRIILRGLHILETKIIHQSRAVDGETVESVRDLQVRLKRTKLAQHREVR